MSEGMTLQVLEWNGESDLQGSSEPERETDQRCDGCGRWFSNRGIWAHSDDCWVREQSALHWEEESERLVKPECPECGAWLWYEWSLEEQRGRHEEGCPHFSGRGSDG